MTELTTAAPRLVDAARRLPLPDEVPRHDLLGRLADRFAIPVITIEAAAGFGKSTLLGQAIDANLDAPIGLDVVVRCRPEDRDATRLATRILGGLGVPDPAAAARDVEDQPTSIAGALAALAPTEIALIVDDVHHAAAGSTATELLAELVSLLPANAHLVVCGRRLPTLPLARLRAASGVAELTEGELAFSDAEMAALARHHGLGSDVLGADARWPALVRLSLIAGHPAAMDFLWEEVVADLDPTLRRQVTALVATGGTDTDTLAALVGEPVAVDELLDLPMIDRLADGSVRAHDLWGEALVDPPDREVLERLVPWLVDRLRVEEALATAARSEAWDLAGAGAVRALRHGTSLVDRESVDAWLQHFPPDQEADAAVLLVRAASRRLHGDVPAAIELAEAARRAFAGAGDRHGEAAALGELVNSYWVVGDRRALLDLYPDAQQLHEQNIGRLGLFVGVVELTLADLEGDAHRSIEIADGLDLVDAEPALVTLIERWRASLLLLVGRADDAVAAAERTLESSSASRRRDLEQAVAVTRWQAGDPEPILHDPEAYRSQTSARGDFIAAIYRCVIGSSLGTEAAIDIDALRDLSAGHARDRTYLAVAAASQRVARDGDELAAAAPLDELLETHGPDDQLMLYEVGRFLPLCAVLSQKLAEAVDCAGISDLHPEARALATLLSDLRRGATPKPDPRLTPSLILTKLPLRWSIELALRTIDTSWGADLAAYLSAQVTEPFWDLLPEVAEQHGLDVEGVRRQIARPPTTRTSISVLGPLTIERDGRAPDDAPLRRERVRQLLALLALRPDLRREQALVLLWPDHEPERSQNNLRVNLSHLRKVLEPDRAAGAPMFLLDERGGRLGLRAGPWLEVDAAGLRPAMAEAEALASAGQLAAAADAYAAIVEPWTSEAFADLRHIDELRPELEEVDRLLVEASCRAGELAIAASEPRRARQAVASALRHDPALERAHRVEVASHMAEGDNGAAEAAMRRCIDAVADLGLRPSDATLMLRRRIRHDAA